MTGPGLHAAASRLDLERAGDELRLAIIECHRRAGGGHLGSSLSIVEILVTLFSRFLRWDPEAAPHAGDRFVLSKGHAALGLYCALVQHGRIPPGRLNDFGTNGAALEPHPNERREPAVHASTGSLGQGLSIGIGLALGSRLRGTDERTFVLLGDGEANEGQIWEAARCAAFARLGNLVAILDDNGLQQDGPMEQIAPVDDVEESWRRMGWACARADGHDCSELTSMLAALLDDQPDRPKLLCACTVKGKGVPFLEGCTESHYPAPLSADDLALLRYDLRGERGWPS